MEDGMSNKKNPLESYFIQFMIGFVNFGGYIGIHQINFSTNELIKTLNIFPHKVNIYMSKLFGLSSLLTIIGALTHHLIIVYYSKNYMTFTIVSLCSVVFTRLILLIVLYKSLSLSFYFFIILSLEAFVSGFFQNSLFVIAPEYTSTTILSVDISLIFSLGIKLIICYFCKENDLMIIKVESWISLSINLIAIGLLLFYKIYYYDTNSNYYLNGIKKIKEILEDWKEINNCSKQIENIDELLDRMLDTINKIDSLEMKDVIENKINNEKNSLEELKNKLEKEHNELNESYHFENTKIETINKLEEFCKKINQSIDFKSKSRISNDQLKIIRKINELHKDIDKLWTDKIQINEKINKMKNIHEETDRIKAKLDDINENIESINRIINRADSDNKQIYSGMLDILRKQSLEKHTDTIKGNIKNLKNKIDIHEVLSKIKPEIIKIEEKMGSKMETNENHLFINVKKCLNQYLIILVASALKDFLYPQIIPHSVLEPDKWSLIEKITPSFYFIGSSSVFFIYSHIEDLERVESYFDFLGVLNVIPFVIFVISLMSIHTKISIFRGLVCSQYKILPITSLLIVSFRIIESYTYVSISNVSEWIPEYNYGVSLLTLHHILTLLYFYIFGKISKGYIDTMSSLGFTTPFLESDNKRTYNFCYLIKNTFKSSFKNIIFDLKINIREYI